MARTSLAFGNQELTRAQDEQFVETHLDGFMRNLLDDPRATGRLKSTQTHPPTRNRPRSPTCVTDRPDCIDTGYPLRDRDCSP